MHPYLPHLLKDIENAKRPGFQDNIRFFSNYDPEEDEDNELFEIDDDQAEWTDIEVSEENPPYNMDAPPEDLKGLSPLFGKDEDDDDDMEEHFAEVERFVHGDPEPYSFGDHCGLQVADFPPAEQLTEEDMQAIIKAYRKMGTTWNIDFAFPDGLPTVLHYNILINTLNERIMIMKTGFTGMDYCSGDPEGCIFGEYCGCIKYLKEYEARKT